MLAKLPCKSMRVLRVWDRDKRDTRIASGKAAPAIGSRQVGDTVLYCRDSRSGKHELRRNARSRLNGFDKDENSLSETQPRDSMFVLMFTDCLHPSCKIVELLVFRFTRTKDFTPLATETQTQHDFIDEHFSFADPSRFVNDDQDDEMPEPTQTTRAEKRKVDETAKELRTLVPLISFSQRAQHDLRVKHTSSSHSLRYKPESQGRELKHFKMSLQCFFERGWSTHPERRRRER